MTTKSDKAIIFHSLHEGGPLVLPNAWDVASARLIERAGATAIATTSAGVAWSLGVADGGRLDRDQAIEVVARIVAAIDAPVTADVEDGYAVDSAGVAETIERIVAAGAVGANIEDAVYDSTLQLRSIADQVERIRAARSAGESRCFINARVDTYLRGGGTSESRLADTLARAEAYVHAGADGIFVPGVTDPDIIAKLVAGIAAPLNILVGLGSPTVAELAELGVARVSLGSSIAEAAYGVARRSADEVLSHGTYDALDGGLDYLETNALMQNGAGERR